MKWRDPIRELSGSVPRGRRGGRAAPEEVGGLVASLLEKWGIAERVERSRTASRWEEIVGERIARHTGEVRVGGRTLFVEVESASWRSELDMMRHRILEKLNEGRESGKIEKIVFLQSDGPTGGRDDERDEDTRGRGRG